MTPPRHLLTSWTFLTPSAELKTGHLRNTLSNHRSLHNIIRISISPNTHFCTSKLPTLSLHLTAANRQKQRWSNTSRRRTPKRMVHVSFLYNLTEGTVVLHKQPHRGEGASPPHNKWSKCVCATQALLVQSLTSKQMRLSLLKQLPGTVKRSNTYQRTLRMRSGLKESQSMYITLYFEGAKRIPNEVTIRASLSKTSCALSGVSKSTLYYQHILVA